MLYATEEILLRTCLFSLFTAQVTNKVIVKVTKPITFIDLRFIIKLWQHMKTIIFIIYYFYLLFIFEIVLCLSPL